MDDPWANAWGEPTKADSFTTATPTPAWSNVSTVPTALSAVNDTHEDDVGLPSWASGDGAQWAEPPVTSASLWNPPASPKSWHASSHDHDPQTEGSTRSPTPDSPEEDPLSTSSPSLSIKPIPDETLSLAPSINIDVITSSQLPLAPPSPIPTPESPDVFGTFETGLSIDEHDADPWTSSGATSIPVDVSSSSGAWETTWVPTDAEREIGGKERIEPDEWEVARQEKQRQDRHVPPELLTSILEQFNALSSDLWPSSTSNQAPQSVDEQDFRNNRYSGMNGIEGLSAAMAKLVPENLTLPPSTQFARTFTSKHMNDALKVTKHFPLAQVSPMALYLASKGSTAWETSVKSQADVVQIDFSPPGWKVVEKEKESPLSGDEGKRKSTSRLLSFFGRGAATPPLVVQSGSPSSPVQSSTQATIVSPVAGSGSTRSSLESTKSTPLSRSSLSTAVTSRTVSSTTGVAPIPEIPPTSTASTFSPSLDPDVFPESTPPPSAVSRFLNRFSRTKSTSSPRNSLALSSDDLEFLSDMVPSASEEVDADDPMQLKALSDMIGSSPLPTKLPPPLAPPPRPPAQHKRVNSDFMTSQQSQNDKFMSFFDSPNDVVETNPTSASSSHSHSPSLTESSSRVSQTLYISPSPKIDLSASSRSSTPLRNNIAVDKIFAPVDFSPSRTNTPVILPKKTVTAIMSTSQPATKPPVVPKLSSSFILPPPRPASRTQPSTTKSTTSDFAGLIPSPPRSQASLSYSEPSKSTLFDDDDDFSDFHTTPNVDSMNLYDSTFSSSSFSSDPDHSLVSSTASTSHSKDIYDDFDDFISSPQLRTPSPPHVPAKTPALLRKAAPPPVLSFKPLEQTSPPPKPQAARPTRATDHQRTMSLLDTAATRTGRWPTPASPLPEPLPGPRASTPISSMQDQQKRATTVTLIPPGQSASQTLSTTSQQWSFPPPPNGTHSSLSFRSLSPPTAVKQPINLTSLVSVPTSPPEAPKTQGGLSAQDLSFFEGL